MMTYIETRWYTCCWLLVISITICMCVHCTIMLLFWEGLLGYSLAPPATLAAPLCYPKFKVANSFNSKQLLCPEALIPCRSNILLAMFFIVQLGLCSRYGQQETVFTPQLWTKGSYPFLMHLICV